MKPIPRSIRLGVLLVVLAIAGYLVYQKFHVWARDLELAQESEERPAQVVDLAALTRQAIPEHVKALKSEDVATRRKAAWALWQIGASARDATPALLEALHDPDAEVRESAARALKATNQWNPEIIRALIAAVQDHEGSVRATAANALAHLWLTEKTGLPAPSKRRREEEDEAEERGRGKRKQDAEAREREEKEEAEREAREAEKRAHGGRGTRPGPARPAPTLGPESQELARAAIPILTAALHDPDSRVHGPAAAALAETMPLGQSALPDLIHVLEHDPDANARLQATLALAALGPAAHTAVPALVRNLHKDVYPNRTNCAVALARIHTDPELAVPALVEAYLKADGGDLERWSVFALQQYGPEAARLGVPEVEKARKDPANQNDKTLQQRADRALKVFEEVLKESKTGGGTKPSSRP